MEAKAWYLKVDVQTCDIYTHAPIFCICTMYVCMYERLMLYVCMYVCVYVCICVYIVSTCTYFRDWIVDKNRRPMCDVC